MRRSVLDILITGYFSTLIVRSKGYKKAIPSLQELFQPPPLTRKALQELT
jgi:hypothetical protein